MSHYEDEVSVLELWRRLSKYKLTILSTILVTVAIMVIASFLVTPVYRSSVLLIAADDDDASGLLGGFANQLGGLAAIAGLEIGENSNTNEAIAILKSRVFTEQFIREENLLPILFSDLWDSEKGGWESDNQEKVPSIWDAYELFDEEIRSIDQDRMTGLITLQIDWKDRELAALWSNLLVHRVNKKIRDDAIAEAKASIAYLNKELEETNIVGLQQAIYRLTEAQLQRIMLANVREEYAFKILDPGVVADEDDPVWPKRLLMLLIGIISGVFLGVLFAIFRDISRRNPA